MIICSACLAGIPCRYDGKAKRNPIMDQLEDYILVCPEVISGLPIPRDASELCATAAQVLVGTGKVRTIRGEDVTEKFRAGANAVLALAKAHNPSAVYLKAKSPSCGCGQIYDGTFSRKLIKGNGVTAELLLQNGFTVISV